MKTKKLIAIILLLCISLFALIGCMGFGASEKIEYQEVEGGYALFRYSGVSIVDKLEIPDTYEGKPVVEIMDYAISGSDYLKTISIGKNVKTIANWAITSCSALENVYVSEENPYFTVGDDGIMYNKDKTILLLCPSASPKSVNVTVPNSVKKINDTAFYLSKNLTTITFNEGLEEIGEYAFLRCEKLTNFTLPSTLKTINKDAFSYCDAITELTIPRNVTKIGDYAFFSLSSTITAIKFQRSESEMSEVSLGQSWTPYQKTSLSRSVPVEYGA